MFFRLGNGRLVDVFQMMGLDQFGKRHVVEDDDIEGVRFRAQQGVHFGQILVVPPFDGNPGFPGEFFADRGGEIMGQGQDAHLTSRLWLQAGIGLSSPEPAAVSLDVGPHETRAEATRTAQAATGIWGEYGEGTYNLRNLPLFL